MLVRPYGDGMKLVLSQDITERERTEAMRRDFVANVSHEIRTPLTVLAGFVETMAQLPLTEAERRRVLALMEQQTDRMQTLVGDLLTLAQLEGSPRPPADRWVPLADLLQRVAGRCAGAVGRAPHASRVSGGDDAELAGSEAELLSAVGNLVNNAVRYTPDGGRIDVRWRWRDDGGGELEVSDTGIGIAREHLPRLTERFYRVDGSRSRDTGGTGLGLSIVKHVVQRHGGEIEIEQRARQGLELPAACFRPCGCAVAPACGQAQRSTPPALIAQRRAGGGRPRDLVAVGGPRSRATSPSRGGGGVALRGSTLQQVAAAASAAAPGGIDAPAAEVFQGRHQRRRQRQVRRCRRRRGTCAARRSTSGRWLRA